MNFKHTAAILLASSMLTHVAWAQDKIAVRAGTGTDYTRLVFEGEIDAPSAKTESENNTITILFRNDPIVSPSSVTAPRIMGYRMVGNGVTIDIPPSQDVRFLTVGKKLIVDIKGPLPKAPITPPPQEKQIPKETVKKESAPTSLAPQTPAQPSQEIIDTKKDQKPAPTLSSADLARRTIAAAKTMGSSVKPPENGAPQVFDRRLEPHVISLASTDKINMAVFERAGRLWIVVDQKQFPLSPQISGQQAKGFPAFERVETNEATAFVMGVPPGYLFRGEGGGLVWKINLGDQPPEGQSTQFTRKIEDKKGELLWPVKNAASVVVLPDDQMGDMITVVTVPQSDLYFNISQNFVDFRVLPAAVGLALVPRVDDLKVSKNDDGVLIASKSGLAVSPDSELAAVPKPLPKIEPTPEVQKEQERKMAEESKDGFRRIFQFDRWIMGGEDKREENILNLKLAMASKDAAGQAQDVLTLAKLELSNGRGAEASGYLDYAGSLLPDVAQTPDFMALEGASRALMGQYDKAFERLSNDQLKDVSELDAWRSYVLAGLEDWTQAGSVLPQDLSFMTDYPKSLRDDLILVLAEVALRTGDPSRADKILELLGDDKLSVSNQAALDYLRGESLRQRGMIDEAYETWEELSKGQDDLYRAKAGLALTTLEAEQKKINSDQAIDRLEGLRYLWRGDELETAINFRLGKLYVEKGDILKGLNLLRQAASLSPKSDASKEITTYMTQTYRDLFLTDKLQKLSPIDAVSIHDEFSELAPVGEEADKITLQLAEHLVNSDLLPRAANMLSPIVDRSTGVAGADLAQRLATIRMMDGKPEDALPVLDKADLYLKDVAADVAGPKRRAVAMLRAQAFSVLKKPDEAYKAIALLDQDVEVGRLRADVAWRNQRWQEAADALEQVAAKSDIPLTRPMSDEQANVILNWGVALYLADNRYVLQSLRDKYFDAMMQTPLSKKFDVVTRPRQNALLADRETISNLMNEIEIFKGFNEIAKQTAKTDDKKPAIPVAPVPEAVPPQEPAASATTTPAAAPATQPPAQ